MTDTSTIVISRYLTLQTDGEVSGLPCGRRPSGVTVARQGEAQNIHLIYAKSHAKVVEASLVGISGVAAKEAGRVLVDKKHPDPMSVIEHVEATIDAAKAAKRNAPVVFPVLDGVLAVVDGDELVVRMDADRDALAGLKGVTWDEARDAFVAPASKAKAAATALKDLVKVRADRAAVTAELARQAAAREAAMARREAEIATGERLHPILVQRLRGVRGAHVSGHCSVTLNFPYDARLVDLARSLPHARYYPGTRAWTTAAASDADVERIVSAATRIAAAIPDLVAARDAEQARAAEEQRQADAAWSRANPYYVERAARAPGVGETLRHHGDVVSVLRHGRRFRADDELSSMGGPIGAEGEWCCRVYYRAATAEEVAALEAREDVRTAQAKAASAVRETIARVDREGETVELGREPEGEVLVRNDRSALHGYATRLVVDGEGSLWTVTYDGSDGGTWGMYNLGYNTRGRRLRVTPGEVEDLRQAIATAGGMM